MVINHAKLQNAVLNTERLSIVMNADNIPAKSISTLMNMTFLLRADGEKQTWKERKS